jgi:hypothetical protein
LGNLGSTNGILSIMIWATSGAASTKRKIATSAVCVCLTAYHPLSGVDVENIRSILRAAETASESCRR